MSDLHGNLPQEIPECDAILIAGDICCHGNSIKQLNWLDSDFRSWLNRVNKPVFACAGNHDWAMYEKLNEVRALNLPWTYLQDEHVIFQDKMIYGSPWQKRFFNWAYNLDESELMGKWNLIPDDVDILICHSPPKYYGDKTSDGEFVGSESLTWRIGQLNKLKLVVFGHIHPGHGIYNSEKKILVNASLLNDRYKMVYKPFVVEI